MTEIHSFIYGIAADGTVRKITVSRDGGATHMTLNPPHGSNAVPVREIVGQDRVPLQEAKRVFDLDEAIEVPADLDETPPRREDSRRYRGQGGRTQRGQRVSYPR